MQYKNLCEWTQEQESRKKVITAFKMPLIAGQLSKKTGIPEKTCSYIIAKFLKKGLLICLNPDAQNSRLYGLSEVGKDCQRHCYPDLPLPDFNIYEVDWKLYGWLCFRHRSAVLKTLTVPMQPSEIKRTLRIHKPYIRISANNVRDIIKIFFSKDLVRPIRVRKKAHPRYELTEIGIKLRQLLIHADSPY